MPDPLRLNRAEMLERAASALGKIDAWGRRGVTMVTADEIEAMACLLAALGLPPLSAGAAVDPGGPVATFPIHPLNAS